VGVWSKHLGIIFTNIFVNLWLSCEIFSNFQSILLFVWPCDTFSSFNTFVQPHILFSFRMLVLPCILLSSRTLVQPYILISSSTLVRRYILHSSFSMLVRLYILLFFSALVGLYILLPSSTLVQPYIYRSCDTVGGNKTTVSQADFWPGNIHKLY